MRDEYGNTSAYISTSSIPMPTQFAKLLASDGDADDQFGYGVCASSDGSTIAVGVRYDDVGANVNQGSVYIFEKPEGGWMDATESAKLTASDGESNDYFGFSVSISSDGSTVIVGAYKGDGLAADSGSAYVFIRNHDGNDAWANGSVDQAATLTASYGAEGDAFGTITSISSNGSTIVVGAYDDDSGVNSGSAYIFEKPSGSWIDATEDAKLTASDGQSGDKFASFLTISPDGSTIAVGAKLDDVGANANQGSGYIFEKPDGGWVDAVENAQITASDGASGDELGYSVSISSDNSTVLVGAYYSGQRGAAYIFEKPVNGWEGNTTENAKLTASDGEVDDYFGFSVSISSDGSTVIVGSLRDDIGNNNDQGSVYIFEKPDGDWVDASEDGKLVADDGSAGDFFGTSVSISSDESTIVVGTIKDDENGLDSGSVYISQTK